jgi:RNA recognition motif-containing protein
MLAAQLLLGAAALLLAPARAFLAPHATTPSTRTGAPLVVRHGVTKKNRRRVTEKNTGGSVGANARRKREAEVPNRIFFANVRYDVTEDALKPFFGAVGPVTHVKIVRDSFTGQSKGYGFCTYSDPLYATTALRSLDGQPVEGRPIRLDDATSLAKRRKEKKATAAFEIRESKRAARAEARPGDGAE